MKSKQVQEFQETEIGKIPVDWEVKKIHEFCLKITSGGTPSRKNLEYWDDGTIPWLKTQELNDGWIYDAEEKITDSGLKNSSAKLFPKGTILIAMYGATVGKLGILETESTTNQAFCAMIVDKKKSNNYYLFYSLLNLRNNLISLAIGAAQQNLNQETIKEFEIPFPSLLEQEKIANIIYSLDIKIKNLQNQNRTLEQTAQAIFQSWFVDFDGVTEFEDSELGKIPKGWSVEKINDICETFGGGTPSTKNPNYWNGQNHWLVPRDLTSSDRMFCVDSERKITDEGLQNCASQMHPEDSIFMTSRATIGAFCINKIPVATNQGFIVSRPKNPNHFYYIFLNYRNRVDEFIREANGSTFLEISRGNFRQLPILVPSPEIIDDFQTKAKLLFENIFNNEEMIVGLTKTRDTLLPKLMSGEIRV